MARHTAGYIQSKWADSTPTSQVWVLCVALSSKAVNKSVGIAWE